MEYDSIIRLLLDDQVSQALQATTDTIEGEFVNIVESAQETAARFNEAMDAMYVSTGSFGTNFAHGMESVGNAAATFGGGFNNVMNGIENVAGSVVERVNGFFTGLADHMRWASLFVGMALLDIGKKALKMGEDTENARIKFDTLFKSPEQGQAMMDFLTKLSLQSTVTRQDIEQMAGKFAGIGMTFNETKEATVGLNDAVVALGLSGQQANGVARNMADIYNRTVPLARNYTQLELDGIQVQKLMANAIKDHTLTLDGMTASLGGNAGASKKLTTEYAHAKELLKYNSDQTQIYADKLQAAKNAQDTIKTSVESANNSIAAYKDRISEATAKIDYYQNRVNKTAAQQEAATRAIDHAKNSINEYNAHISTANDRIGNLNARLGTSQGAILSAQMAQDKYNDKLATANQHIAKYVDATQAQHDAIIATAAASDRLTDEQVKQLGTMQNGQVIAMALSKEMEKMYSTAAIAHANTLQGLLSSTFDALQLITQSIMGITIGGTVLKGGIFDNLKTSIQIFVDYVRAHIDDIQKFFNNVGKSLSTTVGAFSVAGVAIGIFIGFLSGILAPVIGVGIVFAALGAAAGVLVDKMGGFKKVSGEVGEWFKNIPAYIKIAADMFEHIWSKVQQLWSLFVQLLQPALKTIKPDIDNLRAALAPLLNILPPIMVILVAIAAFLINSLAFAIQGVILIFRGLVTFLSGVWDVIRGIFTLNLGLIGKGFKEIFEGIAFFIAGWIEVAISRFIGLFTTIVKIFQMLYDKLVGHSIIPDLFNAITKIFDNLCSAIKTAIDTIVGTITNGFTGLINAASNWGKSLINNFLSGIKGALSFGGKIAGDIGKMLSLPGYAAGGIVPGPIGQAVPIIAHGGEIITPSTGGDVMGGGTRRGQVITINLTGDLVIDSDERIQYLAQRIGQVLGRQNELTRYGAGY